MDFESFERDAPGEDVVVALQRDGAVIVRNQVGPEIVEAVLEELRADFDAEGTRSQSDFNGYKTLRLSLIPARSRTSLELIAHPRVLEIADAVLLPHCLTYQIGSMTAIEIHPGETAQHLHTDEDALYPVRVSGVPFVVSAMWALRDFTQENGATCIVPRSHKAREAFPVPSEKDAVQAPMPAGSVLFYMGGTLHGGGANRSDLPRAGLVTTYNLGWLQPEVNQLLAIPRDIAESFPERMQRLLGYESHGKYLRLYPGDPDGTWTRSDD